MKVYIVNVIGNDYFTIRKVFATQEKAKEYASSKRFKEVLVTICEKEVIE